jgi:IS6 family transposase
MAAKGRDFKGRQFTTEVILWAVRWYLMFPISYRDLELVLLDRGIDVNHTTPTPRSPSPSSMTARPL